MSITDAQADDFDKYARNPETWVIAARRSFAVARLLMNRSVELRVLINRDFFESSGCYYAGYFHAGVALENAAKAVLISRNPTIVSKGGLDINKFGRWSSHALLKPIQSILGSLTEEERRLITKIQEFVWAGRYAVPAKAEVLYDEERMNNIRQSTPDELSILQSLIDRIVSKIEDKVG